MNRTNKVLLALLLLQFCLVANVFWTQLSAQREPTGALFEDFNPDAVTSVFFMGEQGDGTEVKKDAKGTWVLPEKDGYPADENKVEEFLHKIQKLDRRVVVASTRSAHSRLKVANSIYNRKVVFHSADSADDEVLFIGTEPTQGQLHVRAGGDDRVFLTRDLSAWEAGTDSALWLKRDYLKVPSASLTEIQIKNPNGSLRFFKGDNGQWEMEGLRPGEIVNTSSVDLLVNRIATVRMQDVAGKTDQPSFGLDEPLLKATLSYRPAEDPGGPRAVVLLVGHKGEDKDMHIAKSSESEFYVSVPAYAIQEVIQAKGADYVAPKSRNASPDK